ncbi:MAG: 30S ribosomal protein S4 [Thermoplasmata archaeon]
MGDPKFPRKTYERPRRPWEKERIISENKILKEYGLKNKRELWKVQSILRKYRTIAKKLQASLRYGDPQASKELKNIINKLVKLGILSENASSVDDILALNIQSILERRLQTIVYRKGLANTPKQARQFIVHGHIIVGDRVVSIPSYLVKKDEEDKINYNPFSPLSNELHPARQKPKEVAE